MLLSVNGNSGDEAASTTPVEAPGANRPPGEEDTLIEDEVGAELQDTAGGDQAVPEEMMAVDPAKAALGDKQGIQGAEAKPVDTSKASDHREASARNSRPDAESRQRGGGHCDTSRGAACASDREGSC